MFHLIDSLYLHQEQAYLLHYCFFPTFPAWFTSGHTSRINRLICTGEFIFSASSDHTSRAWLYDPTDVLEETENSNENSAANAETQAEKKKKESSACIKTFKVRAGSCRWETETPVSCDSICLVIEWLA